MAQLTRTEQNQKILDISSATLKEPWNDALQCAFRPKSRGEGIILDEERLKGYQKEFRELSRKVDREAEKRTLDKLFGKDRKWDSIWDYGESAVPPPPKDYNEKKDKFNTYYANSEQEAIKLADKENIQRSNQGKKKYRRNSNDYKYLITKYQKKLALEKTFGKDSPYESLTHYRYHGKGKSNSDFKPDDYDEKYDLERKYKKEFREEVVKELISEDPSLLSKDRCLVVANNYHHETKGNLFSVKYSNYGLITDEHFSGRSRGHEQIGSVIRDAINKGYPTLLSVPPEAVSVTRGLLGSGLLFRSEPIIVNKDKERYFTADMVRMAKNGKNMVLGKTILPYGWGVIENEKDSIIVGSSAFQKTQRGLEIITPKADQLPKLGSNYSYCKANKLSDGWEVQCNGSRLPNKWSLHKSKSSAIKYMKCNMKAFENAYMKTEEKLASKIKDEGKHDSVVADWRKNVLNPIIKKEQKKC